MLSLSNYAIFMEIDSRHHAQVWNLFLLLLFQKREGQEGEKMLTIAPQKQSPVPQSLPTGMSEHSTSQQTPGHTTLLGISLPSGGLIHYSRSQRMPRVPTIFPWLTLISSIDNYFFVFAHPHVTTILQLLV